MKGRTGQLARGADLATGAVAAVLVFVAVPGVLARFVGLPLPARWTVHELVSLHSLFDLFAIVAWVSWAACCWPLLCGVVWRVRHRDVQPGTHALFGEKLAARIATAVLVVVPVGASLGSGAAGARTLPAASSTAPPLPPAPPTARPSVGLSDQEELPGVSNLAITASLPAGPRLPQDPPPSADTSLVAAVPGTSPGATPAGPAVMPPSPAPVADVAPAPPSPPVDGTEPSSALPGPSAGPGTTSAQYTVRAGDTLWSIAEHVYGDGAHWSELASANLGHVMIDGSVFVDPGWIRAGWVLDVPGPAPGNDLSALRRSIVQTHQMPPGPVQGAQGSPPTAGDPALEAGDNPAPLELAVGRPRGHPPAPVNLPELATLGVGAIVAGALARKARRIQFVSSQSRRRDEPADVPSDAAAGMATLLAPFRRLPALELLDSSNRQLTAALASGDALESAPPIELVGVGPRGVSFQLASAVEWAPPGWALEDGGRRWHLRHDAELRLPVRAQGFRPWLPALVPVGDNTEGSWLLPAEPGTCIPVLGIEAEALLAAMRLAVANWPWADGITVTADPSVAEAEASATRRHAEDLDRARVVFFGDPADLRPLTRALCSVITARPVAGTGVTVTVDSHAASLHPLGMVVRPHLLDGDRHSIENGLLAPAERIATGSSSVALRAPGASDGNASTPHKSQDRRASDVSIRVSDPVARGLVEVRLLNATPRVEGLPRPLDPKRARRAVELVAYLALHHPSPVTGERLRTRVLGSADADAAAKTLFNVAHAARAALGEDENGGHLLPAATRLGHYRVAPSVTVDVRRSEALLSAARRAPEEGEAIALSRAALELIDSEPLANTLTGYGWWSAEGHEGRIAAVVIDGACRLAAMAVAHGHIDLARWAIDQARMLDSYSEALTVAAMRVAAGAGDPDRIRREWRDCQRRVDELVPGSLPSLATEHCYIELCRQHPAATAELDC